MKKGKKLLFALIIITTFVLIGGSVVFMLNQNNRPNYKLYEENGNYYYKDYFSNEKIWIAFSDEIALIHEYKRTFGKTYVGLNIWKYINPNGDVILQPDIYLADAFSEGLAAVIPSEGQKWGYMDIEGNIIINPQYSRASMFRNGVASVYIEEDGGKWIQINKKGEVLQALDGPLNWDSQTQADPKNDMPNNQH